MSKKYVLIALIFIVLSGCGTSIKVSPTDIGSKTLKSFEQDAKQKGYVRVYYEEYYGYKIVGWREYLATLYFAIFGKDGVLVEFLGSDVPVDLSAPVGQLALKLDEIEFFKQVKSRHLAHQLAELNQLVIKEKKPYVCINEMQCDKAFTLTQIYISQVAEMKIQLSTDTIIETYSSSKHIAMKATKVPGKGTVESIYLEVIVPYSSFDLRAKQRELDLLKGYQKFLEARI